MSDIEERGSHTDTRGGAGDELYRQRLEKLNRIKERGETPYKYRFHRTHTVEQILEDFKESAASGGGLSVSTAGRVTALRDHGKSTFADIRDDSGQIQIYLQQQNLGQEEYKKFSQLYDIGDFVGVCGEVLTTRTGEVTIKVNELTLLAKSLRPLPEKWHGLRDVETRYRQRYLDLIANPQVKEIFLTRSQIIREIRAFLDARGFVEVETPMMQPIAGGATARPFVTYHEALNRDLYLRIAPELYLKRLIVGGFEKVYEINRNFRNEGVSVRHNPEFTMLELYQAYVGYDEIMVLVEDMVAEVVQRIRGTLRFTYQGNEIDLSAPWPRVPLFEAIQKYAGVDMEQTRDPERVRELVRHLDLDVPRSAGYGKIVDEVLKKYVVQELIQPTFLIEYPVELSPLAKRKLDDENLTERFQPFIGSLEVGNAFSELNDPLEQRERFMAQLEMREKGDDEAHMMDEDFIQALEYGMPPTGGLGFGIDRFVMLLTDSSSIRDVILFPQLRTLA